MPRKPKPLNIVYEYAAQTDVERCARALVRLLLWEPPPAPAPGAEDRGKAGNEPEDTPHA